MLENNKIVSPYQTINCAGTLLDLSVPVVMGILNLTPDSFFDGGKLNSVDKVLKKAEQMIQAGAGILDLGGMSSRPGAELIDPEEEIKRILPALKSIRKKFPEQILSIDTVWSKVAQAAIDHGIQMVNDISAGKFDPLIFEIAAQGSCPYILMHMQGKPENMQDKPSYDNLMVTLSDFFRGLIPKLKAVGIIDIILDPGFGFGKTIEHNYKILAQLKDLQLLGYPILIGISRKPMIWKVISKSAEEALVGTAAAQTIALLNGASILRVHDVAEAVDTVKVVQAYLSNKA